MNNTTTISNIENNFNFAAHQTAIQFHAQPYNLDATGFYFSSNEEFEEKSGKCVDRFGCAVEEFEIQFIDGSSEAAALFCALEINQANFAEFIDLTEDKTADELASIAYLAEMGYSFENAVSDADNVMLREGRLEDAAEELFDECYLHEIPERLQSYIDYTAFANDCRLSGDLVEFEFAETTYTCVNANSL